MEKRQASREIPHRALSGWGPLVVFTIYLIGIWVLGASLGTQRAPWGFWLFASLSSVVVLVGYVGFQYLQKQKALEFGSAYAASHGLPQAKITAHPRPVSPFNWTVFASTQREHRFAHVNLVRREPRAYQPGDGFFAKVDSPYLPLDQAVWVVKTRFIGRLSPIMSRRRTCMSR